MAQPGERDAQQSAVVSSYPWLISRLPEPEERWRAADLEGSVQELFRKNRARLIEGRVIERVSHDERDRAIYQTHGPSQELAQDMDRDRDTLPCGCRVAWIQEGDQLRCKTCRTAYEKDALRDFLG